MSDDGWSRQELARFLRSRRARVTPEQVGFPAGAHRRTKGLRREEVAVLAGLSPTWYTYLEQGRDIRPSIQVLDSLARVLDLSEDERRYMHTLAHGQVVNPQPLEAEEARGGTMRRVVGLMGDNLYPVYATDVYCDLIAWNDAAAEWYDDWGAGLPNTATCCAGCWSRPRPGNGCPTGRATPATSSPAGGPRRPGGRTTRG